MPRSHRRDGPTDDHVEKGPSLARLPTHLVGTVLTVAGLALLLKNGTTPNDQFPDGTVSGDNFLGFETNGWTAFLTIAAGAALLFGAAQHLAARTMALIVGLALGACSSIALYDGDDVLGLAAANGPTKLGWGIAAAVLLVIALMPRTRRHHDGDADRGVRVEETDGRPRTGRFSRGEHAADPVGPEDRTVVPRDEDRIATGRPVADPPGGVDPRDPRNV